MGGSQHQNLDEERRNLLRPEPQALAQAAAVARVLVGAERVLVTAHLDPDGDACGSSLGLAAALREMGREVVVYADAPCPQAFVWLPGGTQVVTHVPADARFDTTVICDAGSMERLGPDLPDVDRRGTLCWVDHHRHLDPPGDVNYVDPLAPAVGEQIREILWVLEHPLSLGVAKCLYAALMTDTGSFRYANTTPRALSLAAELVACGVSSWEMTERIYESQPPERLRLLSRVLQSLEISSCGRFASITIVEGDLAATGACGEHTDGFINYPRSIAGVEVAIQFRQRDGGIKVGFRSRGNVDVRGVAEQLGGGGHANAAGCRLRGPMPAVREQVFQAVQAALEV